ncbi:hypothetical protein Emag_007522 [Eimeria magna]
MVPAAFRCVSFSFQNVSKRLGGPSLPSVVSSRAPRGAPLRGPWGAPLQSKTSHLILDSPEDACFPWLPQSGGCACSSESTRKLGALISLGPVSDLSLGPPSAPAATGSVASPPKGPPRGRRETHEAFPHACGAGTGLVTQLRLSAPRWAPKKKGGPSGGAGGGGPPGAGSAGSGGKGAPSGYDHVFNIYRDIKEDHEMLPDEFYPGWLWRLAEKPKTYGELASIFLYGRGIEAASASDFTRFCRLHRKMQIQLNNARLKKSKRNSLKPIFWDV